MPVEQNSAQEIGVVTGVSGDAYAQSASGMRALEPGSPIYQGEELVTGDGGNIEVRFVDDTLISQGGNSRIALDDYVYDPDGGDSSFLGDIAEGTFRTVTGKIAEQNPERFKLGSPLATIGIRGTIILSEVTGNGEKHGVEQLHAGKAMLLQSKATGQLQQLFSGQMSDVTRTGMLGPARPLSTQELNQFRDIAKANIRQEQEIQQQREEEEEQQNEQNDEQQDEQQQDEQQEQGQEEQQGEQQGEEEQQGEQQGEQPGEPQGELPGDVIPGGGELQGSGGVLPGGEIDGGGINPGQLPQPTNPPQVQIPEPPITVVPEPQPDPTPKEKEEITDLLTGTGEVTEEESSSNNDTSSGSDPHDIHGSGLIKGTEDNDTITGASSSDTIYGDLGNDTLYGESGDDTLEGNKGTDTLYGGSGDDELYGQCDNDTLYGGAGEDMLKGGGGSNYLDGGSGAAGEVDFASFDGQDHGVTVDLSVKNDAQEVIVTVDDGQDTLVNIEGVIGTGHQDTLTGDENINFFDPGLNAEFVSDGTYETVSGGSGIEQDWVQFESLTNQYWVYAELSSNHVYIKDSADSNANVNKVILENIENLIGSSAADSITGNTGVNILKGGAGDDSIDANCGNDTVYGEGGNDTIDGGDNDDYIEGGIGNDDIKGGSGDDTLYGNQDKDALDGGDGDDKIYGGTGDDSIMGGTGANVLDGGEGTDSLSYGFVTVGSDYGINITMTASGTGTAKDSDTGTYINDSFAAFEKILGTEQHDSFSGSDGADTFEGNKGNDIIDGGLGNDVLDGGDGLDTLSFASLSGGTGVTIDLADNSTGTGCMSSGGGGNDMFKNFERLIGSDYTDNITGASAGSDTIIGGGGEDNINLITGQASNLEYYSLSDGGVHGDNISNFQSGEDKLTFSTVSGDFAASAQFTSVATYSDFTDTGAYFIYAEDTDKLYYDADGTGTTHSAQEIANFDSDVSLTLGTNLIVS
ncbi:FecR domain-containing protein [Desulfovibrio sp. JC010]|uniref:FecR domain-containing protein n=1 Tax=Desulfovibrio sp. JC010 TaxID=2593641 RepID=UPI0013D1687C|nr:FecR domain-containing protein [Desulfovibrio sp. JC010]NDV28423.1 hypothetical protein [Desulfovibrio sp. JC010]